MESLGPLGAITGVLDIIWFVCIFFVPFVLLGMSRSLKELNQSTRAMLELQLQRLPDEDLSPELLMKRYSIVNVGDHFHVLRNGETGKGHYSLQEAIEESKSLIAASN